jgi:hypothetical protein
MDRMQDQQQVYPGVVEKSQQPQGHVEVSFASTFVSAVYLSSDTKIWYLLWCGLSDDSSPDLPSLDTVLLLSSIEIFCPFLYMKLKSDLLHCLVIWNNNVRCSISKPSIAMASWQIDMQDALPLNLYFLMLTVCEHCSL